MLKFNTEYFDYPYYVYLKDKGDKFSVYFSISNTLSEARKTDEKIDFDMKDKLEVTGVLKKALKDKKHKKTSDLHKELKDLKKKTEVDEFIDMDGTLSTSRVKIINRGLSPKRTTDQIVIATRMTNNPVTRGYRVYYGENKTKDGKVINELSPVDTDKLSRVPKKRHQIITKIKDSNLSNENKEELINIVRSFNTTDLPYELIKMSKSGKHKTKGINDEIVSFLKDMLSDKRLDEVDYSDAFGYEETKDMDGEKTFNYLKDKLGMDPIEAAERTKQFGKDYTGKRKKNAPKKIKNDPKFIDRMTLSEMERLKMIKMVEDILSKKKDDGEIQRKENKISKILIKNLESIKKIAQREGISINQLIKILKTSE